MPSIAAAYHSNNSFSFNNTAISTNFFHRCPDFHIYPLQFIKAKFKLFFLLNSPFSLNCHIGYSSGETEPVQQNPLQQQR